MVSHKSYGGNGGHALWAALIKSLYANQKSSICRAENPVWHLLQRKYNLFGFTV